jgi:glycosyltransferase involved in cell wall biosynthesis
MGGAIYQTENSQRTLDEFRQLAATLEIADRVGFTGYVADTASAIRSLDILVHASTQPEPFGRVIAEGMACGRAVICSNAGGAAELFTDGQDALAHPPGDVAALAARIAELARDPEQRARLGRAGRATAERRFDLSRLASELISVYRRLNAQTAPATPAQLAALR